MSQTVEGVATNAAGSIVDTGVLGALVIVLVALCIAMFLRLNTIQNLRVEDQKEMSKQILSVVKDLNQEATKTEKALQELTESNDRTTDVLQGVRTSIDQVVLEAVRRSGAPAARRIEVEPDGRHGSKSTESGRYSFPGGRKE